VNFYKLVADTLVPQSVGFVDWLLVGLSAFTVILAFYRAVYLTIRPGETEPDHIKRTVLEGDS
jgi:hypothetical protein